MSITTPDLARLPMWVIYDHPSDWPNSYVARLHYSLPKHEPSGWTLVFDDIERLRAKVREYGGAQLFPRSPGDDPVIVESWML